MARPYYLTIGWQLADEQSLYANERHRPGFSSGCRVSMDVDDETIDQIARIHADAIARDWKRQRDYEAEKDRQKAEPFWKKWVGGV